MGPSRWGDKAASSLWTTDRQTEVVNMIHGPPWPVMLVKPAKTTTLMFGPELNVTLTGE